MCAADFTDVRTHMGSTGYQSVPSGDSPDGMGKARFRPERVAPETRLPPFRRASGPAARASRPCHPRLRSIRAKLRACPAHSSDVSCVACCPKIPRLISGAFFSDAPLGHYAFRDRDRGLRPLARTCPRLISCGVPPGRGIESPRAGRARLSSARRWGRRTYRGALRTGAPYLRHSTRRRARSPTCKSYPPSSCRRG